MNAIEKLAGNEVSQATAVEQARAVAEVAAAVKVAQDFPRDPARALSQVQQSCSQRALADRAFFSLPRGGQKIEGATVHLARELARCWGNTDYGVRELRRDDDAGISEMQAWAWDQELNVRSSRSFIVPHARMARGSRSRLTDLADISNNNNSVAARALRETIFAILPVWFREAAEQAAHQSLSAGDSADLATEVSNALAHFADQWNVTKAQLEARVGAPVATWTSQTLGVLRVLSGQLARSETTVADEFEAKEITTAELIGGES